MPQKTTFEIFPLAPWELTVQQTHELVNVYGVTIYKGTERDCIRELAKRLAHKITQQ